MEIMENDSIPKRVYIGECIDIRSVGRPWKRWIGTMKNCLKTRGVNVR